MTFSVELSKGETRLETEFSGEKGESWGAYYVIVVKRR